MRLNEAKRQADIQLTDEVFRLYRDEIQMIAKRAFFLIAFLDTRLGIKHLTYEIQIIMYFPICILV